MFNHLNFTLIKKYDIVKKFPECRKKLDGHAVQFETIGETGKDVQLCTDANNIRILKNLINDKYTPERICIQAINYLGDINYGQDQNLQMAGCEYFYYWIYDDLLKEEIKGNMDTQNVYDHLIGIFTKRGLYINKLCKPSKTPLKNDDFQKIKDIYNLYKKLYKQSEVINPDDIFKGIVSIVMQYEEKIYTQASEIKELEAPSPCKTNILSPIIITSIITFLTFIFLFILYRFTAFGSWCKNVIKSKIDKRDNINEETHRFQEYEIFSSTPTKYKHNIWYH
ncbi:variable surface protein [Plasmodium gonderi]|uniref:Variable surface protein n=1 Tax=Plasmodium gonderi TaxID=77519 RepID=A0A1Y1J9M4_PLAGO|nr:variable surface protein [Plasmodium gonderi]GAW79199.1 variable surface protein [Plasmodium gonderi]